ncbi:Protein TITANIA, partial [Camellia lanceoleosa]
METEEKRRKKHEEVKMLENSHFDYYKMKMIMQIEIAGLLEIMEAIKQQWAAGSLLFKGKHTFPLNYKLETGDLLELR